MELTDNHSSEPATSDEPIDRQALPARDAEQIRRAISLLDLSDKTENLDDRFALQVGSLHLARAIPEYWMTIAENIANDSKLDGKDKRSSIDRLRNEFEDIFRTARRFELLSDLRNWDFHWEPLINPITVPPNMMYSRNAPLKLAAGPGPGSVAWIGGGRLITSGSGRRVGRTNRYEIQQQRYVDAARSEALPLGLAVRQFLEDVPRCIFAILKKPGVADFPLQRGAIADVHQESPGPQNS